MSRKLLIAFTAALFVLAGTTFAAVENIKVSGDIAVTAVNRNLAMGNDEENFTHLPSVAFGPNVDEEDFVFSQVRLRFDADLTEGVSAVVRLINERMWGSEDEDNGNIGLVTTGDTGNRAGLLQGGDTEIDLDLAYIEMKEFLYQPLTLVVGRQNLRYGNGLIIGDPDTNQMASVKVPTDFADLSLRKSFDAFKAILDYSPYTVDIIYAKLDENTSDINDDRDIMGVNAAYDWASYNGVTEGYFFYANQLRDNMNGTPLHIWSEFIGSIGWPQVVENQSSVYTLGGRAQYDPNDNWTLGVEGAYQFGDVHIANNITGVSIATNPYQHLSAFAAQLVAQYRFLNDYNTMAQLEYTYLSGDDDITDERHSAWNPMYEDQSPGELVNAFFPQSGTQCVTLRGSMMPREDITIGGLYTWLLLSEKVNYDDQVDWYTPIVGPFAPNQYKIEGNSAYIGSEIDGYMLYDYTEDVQIKLTGATFIPGGWFHSENNNIAYQMKAGVSVDF